MKRSPITRGTVWRKARPIVRPGVTPKMPKGWRGVCARIRKRDKGRCRRCGDPTLSGHTDHLVPRKLLVVAELALQSNLATLCFGCHSFKTMVLEPRLYRGDVLAFDSFLAVVGKTGPVPSPHLKARAYKRLKEALYSDHAAM